MTQATQIQGKGILLSEAALPTPVKPVAVVSLLAFNYFSGVIPFTPASQRRFFWPKPLTKSET